MSLDGSVTGWIAQLQAGEETALAKLHERYWPALVELARKKLRGVPGRAADEEDVAQEAFWAFYHNVRAGRVPRLASRHDLLALLTHIIACKAVNQIKHEVGTRKRGGGRDQFTLDSLTGADGSNAGAPTDGARTPLDQAILNDLYHHYVSGLRDSLRDFAELYLAGCAQMEIAERMHCSLRTVERKVALILDRWRAMAGESLTREEQSISHS
jgi:DNA-directed RNA polymerase specialized sigma24 family protein